MRADCTLKVLDFGLARNFDVNARMTPYIVTRYYRAPEVILQMGYKPNVDIWSVGCIFAEMVKGRVLFPGSDHIDQWQKIADLLGMPNADFCSRLQPTVRNFIESRTRNRIAIPFENLFPDRDFPEDSQEHTVLCRAQARDLLSKMLVIDPNRRMTVEEALNHPYIRLWFDESEVNGAAVVQPPQQYDHSIDERDLTVEQWRALLFDEICDFMHEQAKVGNSLGIPLPTARPGSATANRQQEQQQQQTAVSASSTTSPQMDVEQGQK